MSTKTTTPRSVQLASTTETGRDIASVRTGLPTRKALAETLRAVAAAVEAEPEPTAARDNAPRYYTRRTAPIEARAWDRAVKEIPSFRPGRELLVRADDLHAWIERQPVAREDDAPANDVADEYKAFASRASGRRSA